MTRRAPPPPTDRLARLLGRLREELASVSVDPGFALRLEAAACSRSGAPAAPRPPRGRRTGLFLACLLLAATAGGSDWEAPHASQISRAAGHGPATPRLPLAPAGRGPEPLPPGDPLLDPFRGPATTSDRGYEED